MSDDSPLIDFYPYRARFRSYDRLAPEGRDRQSILDELATMAHEEDRIADLGHVSGSIYHGGHDHYAFLTEAFRLFAHANVLQRDMYPSATKLEAEIVAMTAAMLHADEACGVVTFGGTESLINPMLVYRDRGRAEKGITEPEVIIPVTAHVALEKAGHLLGIKVIKAPLTKEWVVDVDWVRDHVTKNTVALVGSAANYAHGLIDPIERLSEIALEHDLGLHVDGCLGGFILPWGERLGYDIPLFDFRVPGVTSISADTHKYGYALKGTSVLLYRNSDLRRYQYFNFTDWPGGIYSITELEVIGNPTFLVAFRSPELNIYHVNDHLIAKGWRLNALQLPAALHFCVTRPNTAPGVADAFLADLRDAVEYAKHPARPEPKSGALYGLGGTPEGNEILNTLFVAALDAMYEVAPTEARA